MRAYDGLPDVVRVRLDEGPFPLCPIWCRDFLASYWRISEGVVRRMIAEIDATYERISTEATDG